MRFGLELRFVSTVFGSVIRLRVGESEKDALVSFLLDPNLLSSSLILPLQNFSFQFSPQSTSRGNDLYPFLYLSSLPYYNLLDPIPNLCLLSETFHCGRISSIQWHWPSVAYTSRHSWVLLLDFYNYSHVFFFWIVLKASFFNNSRFSIRSVFDVTKGKSHYGAGGGYNHFAGRSVLLSLHVCLDILNTAC